MDEYVYDDGYVVPQPRPITYKITENGCWECTSHTATSLGGYTSIWRGGRHMLHRYVYQQNKGPIPDGMVIMHKCDNPRCFNPDHLNPGTHLDNMRDKTEKGRGYQGEDVWTAKLNPDKVMAIRADNRLNAEIAKDYGICKTVVSRVKRREIWKHVKEAEYGR